MSKTQVRAIIPEKFDADAMLKVLRDEFERYAPHLVKDLERTTAHWTGAKPKFKPHIQVWMDREMRLEIRLAGPEEGVNKWIWINEGTRPHKIRPKGNYPLRFQTGYVAGSKAGSTFTMRASRSGGWRTALEVNHPGNAPREWSQLIEKNHQKPFERWMDAAMSKAARASGHEIKK